MTETIQVFSSSADASVREAFCTSGTSPTGDWRRPATTSLHLLGPGAVGRAWLRLLPDTPFRLVGVTDSSGTVHGRDGLDPLALAATKALGGRIADLRGAESLPVDLALDLVNADLVVDATPTGVDPAAAVRRSLRVLSRGKGLALAAKDALCAAPAALLGASAPGTLGIHAALGGTGAALLRDLHELRRDCASIAIVGNASTTAVIAAVEQGASIDEGIAAAQRSGVLEPDPEQDLSGADAVTKVVAVAGALWCETGAPLRPADVLREHLRSLDPVELRRRRRQGRTTRLVARAARGGVPAVRFETLPRSSPLAVPATHVAYTYALRDGSTRVHTGHGIGPARTAAALFRDVRVLAAAAGATEVRS